VTGRLNGNENENGSYDFRFVGFGGIGDMGMCLLVGREFEAWVWQGKAGTFHWWY
jgi:hypothetical protein